ncbi:MAG: squalene/phytoene synthase family protein [Rhodospirillales bacterium]|nr:squalene/phytoene synthase family protein [Rhodospirillales bacterium]
MLSQKVKIVPPDLPGRQTRTRRTENFPVGSWLLPARLRPAVVAFYDFARAADDIADNPLLPGEVRATRLDALDAVLCGAAPGDDAAAQAAAALRDLFAARGLPIDHPRQLLQAFRADAINRPCRSWSDLLAYCRYSAAPVGRFLLDLHGESRDAWPAADALCAALQIGNHLQDCQADFRDLNRVYIPADWLAEAGLMPRALLAGQTSPELRAVFVRMLDGVDRLNRTAASLPRLIADRGLRMEASAILEISLRLARRLRDGDPLRHRVALPAYAKLAAMLRGALRGWRR